MPDRRTTRAGAGRGRRYAEFVDQISLPSLYLELSEPADDGRAPGQTNTTKAKETVDNDVESLLLETLAVASYP